MLTHDFSKLIRICGLFIPFLLVPFSFLSFYISYLFRDSGGYDNVNGSPEYLKILAMKQQEFVIFTLIFIINLIAIILVLIVLQKKRKSQTYIWKFQNVILLISLVLIIFFIYIFRPFFLLRYLFN